MCVCVCAREHVCAGEAGAFYSYLTFAKSLNLGRAWRVSGQASAFHTNTEGFSTWHGNTLAIFCPNSLFGFRQITSLGLPFPLCKVRDMTYKKTFPQMLEEFGAPSVAVFLSELQGVVLPRGPWTWQNCSIRRTGPAFEFWGPVFPVFTAVHNVLSQIFLKLKAILYLMVV